MDPADASPPGDAKEQKGFGFLKEEPRALQTDTQRQINCMLGKPVIVNTFLLGDTHCPAGHFCDLMVQTVSISASDP